MIEDTEKQTAEIGGDDRDERGRFAEGNSGGPGRPPGSPNHISAQLKGDIMDAYEQRGGVEWLAALPDRLFVGLIAKVLPREKLVDLKDQEPPVEIRPDVLEMMGRLLPEPPADLKCDYIGAEDLPAYTPDAEAVYRGEP